MMNISNLSTTFKVIVLISGRGSNLGALLDAIDQGAPFQVTQIISDNPDAAGLQLSANRGVPTTVLARNDFSSKRAFFTSLSTCIQQAHVDLIVLAGFMRILPAYFIEEFANRIVNIHPSLLPKFPGLDTHARALAAGEREHGATVHIVDAGVDTGPILAQAQCDITADDTPDTLRLKVLKREHQLLPWVVSMIAQNEVNLNTRQFSDRYKALAQEMNFIVPLTV